MARSSDGLSHEDRATIDGERLHRFAAVRAMQKRRGLSEGEGRLLRHISLFGSDGYPIQKLGRKWAWGCADVLGPPVTFKTKTEAVDSFEQFHGVLLDALAGRI